MATATDNLRRICIYPWAYGEEDCDSNLEEIMNVIAEGTKNVEEFHFYGHSTALGAFDKFIDKKKSALRSFSIINWLDDFIPQAHVNQTMIVLMIKFRNVVVSYSRGTEMHEMENLFFD